LREGGKCKCSKEVGTVKKGGLGKKKKRRKSDFRKEDLEEREPKHPACGASKVLRVKYQNERGRRGEIKDQAKRRRRKKAENFTEGEKKKTWAKKGSVERGGSATNTRYSERGLG